MKLVNKLLILSFILMAFLLSLFYFKKGTFDFLNFLDGLKYKIEELQKVDTNLIVSEIEKKISLPYPLVIQGSGKAKDVVLLKSKIIEETNLQRKKYGLPELKENFSLSQAALFKANDILKNQYFDHVSPTGLDPSALIKNFGYEYLLAGENLILGEFSSEREVVEKWMESPDHRANILNQKYTEIGVAILKGNYQGNSVWIGVQEFALPLSTCRQPDSTLKKEIEFEREQLDDLFVQIQDLRKKVENINYRDSLYPRLVEEFNGMIKTYNTLTEKLKEEIIKYNEQVKEFNNCINQYK